MKTLKIICCTVGIPTGFILLYGHLTGYGKRGLTEQGKAVMLLSLYALIVTILCIRAVRANIRIRVECHYDYVKDLKRRYENLEDAYLQLNADMGALEGKADVNEQYLNHEVRKFSRSGMSAVDELNGQFVSRDGMSKKDKQKLAYELHNDGLENDEIAAEIGISIGTVKGYISEGKRLSDSVTGLRKDGNTYHVIRETDQAAGT